MRQLASVILRHQTTTGTHYDWLFESPHPGDRGALISTRIQPPPAVWSTLHRIQLAPQPLHRRHYLIYQGPISGHRGQILRVDAGRLEVLSWQPAHQVFRFRMQAVTGVWEVIHAGNEPAWLCLLPEKS